MAREHESRRLIIHTEGSILVEYILIASVAITVALALASVGPRVVRGYAEQQQHLYRSNP